MMITSASAYFLLGLMYLLIDFLHLWCGAPFNSAGNLLILYFSCCNYSFIELSIDILTRLMKQYCYEVPLRSLSS